MDGFRFMRIIACFLLVFSCLSANAQTVEVKLHFDNDGVRSGCDVDLTSMGSTLGGIDVQVTATVDRPSRMVTAVTVADCDGGSFGSPQSIGASIPLGLDNGINGSDVVEIEVPSGMVWHAPQHLVFYASAQNLRTSGQDLAGVAGNAEPPAGTGFYIYQAIPAVGLTGMVIIGALLLLVGLLVLRKRQYLLAVSLLSLAGICFAANFIADGNVGDWGTTPATISDSADDAIPADRTADIQAVFLALEGGSFFARVDISDLEAVPPTADDSSATVLEDGSVSITLTGSDVDGDSLTFLIATPPASGSLGAITPIDATSASLVYTPDVDFNGADSFTFKVSDSLTDSTEAVVDVTVTAVNDAPSFAAGAAQTVLEDAGNQTVPAWATGISPGPADEAGQTVSFNVSSDNNALFAVQPMVNAAGDLSYTPADDANGSAAVTIEAMDDGGTANGGVDTSAAQTFTITVSAVNEAPSFTKGADVAVLEDAGTQTVPAWATGISPGPADEAGQTVSFNVSNDNNALFAVQPMVNAAGDLSFTPADDANGSATVTIEAMDDGGTANGGVDTSAAQTFTITVSAVNDESSFSKGADVVVLEDAGTQTVPAWATGISPGPADEAGQTVSFNVSNDNNALFAVQPMVNAAGDLSFTPADDANGSATVTIEAMDDGGTANGGDDTSQPSFFLINVLAVNDPPTFTKGPDQSIDQDSSAQTVGGWASGITVGPADEAGQVVNFGVSNDNNGLFSAQPAVDGAGTLSYMPAPGAFGSALVSVTAMDDGGIDNGGINTSAPQTFTITVVAANTAPVLSPIGSTAIDELAPFSFTAAATDDDVPAQILTFSLSGSVPAGASITPAGVFTWTPTEEQGLPSPGGMYTFDVVVTDDGVPVMNDFETITITVNEDNQNPLAVDVAYEATGNVGIAVANVNGLSVGDSDADLPPQVLSLSVETVPTANGGSANIASDGSFSYTPPAGYTGVDTFTYTLNDDQGGTDTGQVSITVSDMLWFIDNSGPAGDGTLAAPFNTLAAFEAVNGNGGATDPAANQCVFLAVGSGANYAGPLTLEAGQILAGSGAANPLATVCGITPASYSVGLPPTGVSRPTITSASDGINLAAGNTLRGLNVGATTGFGIGGSVVGSLNVSNVSVLGTGAALGIATSGTLAGVGFDTLECLSNSADPCIRLNAVSGTLGVTSGGNGLTHTGAGDNVSITASSVNLAYPGSITKTSGSGSAVSIQGNAGGVITLSGDLTISTGANHAFVVANGGTLNVTGSNNTIVTTTGTGIDINATTIGSSGVTFRSVSVDGATRGILINSSGAGGFIITGDGATAGSGGTIQNVSGRGIDINSTDNIGLSFMNLTTTAQVNGSGASCNSLANSSCNAAIHLDAVDTVNLDSIRIDGSKQIGLNGVNVSGLTILDSVITNAGDEINEGALQVFGLTGTSFITNSTLSFPSERVAYIRNNTGTLDLTISGSTFSDSQSSVLGADGLEVSGNGSAMIDLTIESASGFLRNRTNGLQVLAAGNSAIAVSSDGTSFDRETGIGLGADLSAIENGVLDFDVTNSPVINGRNSHAFNSFVSGASITRGRLDNNTDIQVGGAPGGLGTSGMGVRLNLNESASAVFDVSNNTISNIGFDAGIQTVARVGTGRMDVLINNNSVAVDNAGFSTYNVWVQALDNNTLCANVTNNTNTGLPIVAFRERTSDAGASVLLEGFNTNALLTWNGNGNTPAGSVSESNIGTLGGGTCTLVPVAGFPFE